ncbi:MAG: DUF4304 domain-containing protein [Syntrophaceae bacterium]
MPNFEKSIRKVISPTLETHGFQHDGLRIFRRYVGNRTEIIEFQKGVRSLQSSFCINIGVYATEDAARFDYAPAPSKSHTGYCTCRDRIGRLRKTWISRGAGALLGPLHGTWKEIFLPRDKWWKIPTDEKDIDELLLRLCNQIAEECLPWFQQVKA